MSEQYRTREITGREKRKMFQDFLDFLLNIDNISEEEFTNMFKAYYKEIVYQRDEEEGSVINAISNRQKTLGTIIVALIDEKRAEIESTKEVWHTERVSLKKAMTELDCTRPNIYYLIKKEHLKAFTIGGRKTYITRESLDAWKNHKGLKKRKLLD